MKTKRCIGWMILTLVLLGGGTGGEAWADTKWWDGDSGNTTFWSVLAGWSTVSNAITPNPGTVPGASDTAIVGIDGWNSSITMRLNGNQSVDGLVFRQSSAIVTLNADYGGVANRTLTLGSGGLTIAGGGKVYVNGSSTYKTLTIALGADQTWRNYNTYAPGSPNNLVIGQSADAASDVDLAGRVLILAGGGGVQLSHNSLHGRIIATGGGSITLGANGVLGIINRNTALNTDRVTDSIGITSYGGKVDFNIATGTSTNYSETVGTLTLSKGALNHVQATQVGLGYTSIFTYAGLSRAGGTSTVLFDGDSIGANTRNSVIITGQSDTSLLGGWATVNNGGFANYSTVNGVSWNAGSALANNTSDSAGVYNFGTLTAAANLTVGALICQATATRTLTLDAYNLTIAQGGLFFDNDANAHTITATSGKVMAGSGSDANLYVTIPTAANQAGAKTISAVIADNGSGKLTLVKAGLGTLTLTSNNTYSGSTVINEGKVNLSTAGGIASSPTIEVLYGGTLDVGSQSSTWTLGASQTLSGSGTLNGNANISGAVAPGVTGLPTSAGTLTVTGNVTFANNAVFAVDAKNASLGGDKWAPGYDRMAVVGTVALGVNAKLDISLLSGESLAVGDRLFIIDNDASDAMTGKFKAMDGTVLNNEGDAFTDGKSFKIYYAADLASGALSGGNDVALEVIAPIVTIVATTNYANQVGPTNGLFTVSRGARTDGSLTVNYTIGGTATIITDYTNLPAASGSSGSVTIPDGQTNATITVMPIVDGGTRPEKTVKFTLASGSGYSIGSPDNDTVTIAAYGSSSDPAPVITNGPGPLAVTLMEDCGSTNLQPVLSLLATNAGTDSLLWDIVSAASHGSAMVSGGTVSPSAPSSLTYAPYANFNGTDVFSVRVTGLGGAATTQVSVTVSPLNDPPTNTVAPGFSGVRLQYNTLTATNGVWNDDADTNTTYTHAVFTNTAVFMRQWQRTDSTNEPVTVTNLADQTNATYTLTHDDKYKWFRVAVTCMDSSNGVPVNASNTAYSAWLQETSTVSAVVVFTNALNDGAWGSYSNWAPDDLPTTNLTAVVGDANVKAVVEAQITGAAYAKNLYVGTNSGSGGTVTMTGGTLTFPAAGKIVVAGAASSTGTLNQTGGTLAGITSGDLTIAGGTGSKGTVLLSGLSAVTANLYVASSPGALGSLVLTNAMLKNYNIQSTPGYGTAIGNASNAIGSVIVRGTSIWGLTDSLGTARPLTLGAAPHSTGLLEVTDNGAVTNIGTLNVGYTGGGVGQLTVVAGGKVHAVTVDVGGTNNSSWVAVGGNGHVGNLRFFGQSVNSVATLTLSNNAYAVGYDSDVPNNAQLGMASNSLGRIVVNDNATFYLPNRPLTVGSAAYSTGLVEVTGGAVTNVSTLTVGNGTNAFGSVSVSGAGAVHAATLNAGVSVGSVGRVMVAGSGLLSVPTANLGNGAGATGRVELQGGTWSGSGVATLGAVAGAVGEVQVTGGRWNQSAALNIGTVAGGTGLVTVANCSSATNITGAVTVGGGAAGDRYGSVTISNATFGGGTAVTVWTNGLVELTGTGSVLRINTLTVNGGTVTNRVRALAGGVDVTNSANTALTVTGVMHLSFEGDSDALPLGPFWGLRWTGTNGYPVLTNGVATGTITVTNQMTGTFSNQAMTVFKAGDNSYTFIGFMNATAPVINDGATGIETNVSEDGIAYLTNLLWASDADGTSWTWTNTTTPANGTVAVNGNGTNPVNWSVFTYTPNANFNGTNSFQVRVTDDALLTDSITVTVVVAAANDAPTNTSPPTISGSGQYGTPWTAGNGVWNDNLDTNAAYTHAMFTSGAGFAYQWQYSNDVDVAGATSATFVPSAAMAGTNIRVRVTCTDGGDGTPGPQSTTAYSAYVTVTAPTNDPPVNTTPPGITGDSSYGAVWTVTNGVWNDNSDTNVHYTHADFTNTAVFTYQWQYSNATPDSILNETNPTFMTTAPMLGTNIRVRVTCTDAGYGVPASTSTVAYSAYKLVTAPSLLVFNETSGDWTNSAHWLPVSVPSAGTPAVIGDLGVKSPATAAIGAGDAASAKDLYVGTNANSSGTLNMTGGTLTFPAAGKIVVAGATSSTGTLAQTGGTLAGITSGDLTIAGGTGSKGTVLLSGLSAVTANLYVASSPGALGSLVLTNAMLKNYNIQSTPGYGTAIGNASNAIGSVIVRGTSIWGLTDSVGTARPLTLGAAPHSTGLLEVTDNGAVTNIGTLNVGYTGGGVGQLTVSAGGKVHAVTVDVGGTNNSSWVAVGGNGHVGNLRFFGQSVNSVATLTLSNNAYAVGYDSDVPNNAQLGMASNSLGRIVVNDNATFYLPNRPLTVGSAACSTGIVEVTGGAITNVSMLTVGNGTNAFGSVSISGAGGVYAATLNAGVSGSSLGRVTVAGSGLLSVPTANLGNGAGATGTVELQGGTWSGSGVATLGAVAGAVGSVQITGGNWNQSAALNIGTVAGATGLVTVANCVQTNITGAVTVGGGTTGDRYGSVTISNATFGGSTAVSVWTNGIVELTGTGSVLRCSTFTCRGGAVTNHIRQFAGGVDVTSSLDTALVITNGGTMFLSFDQGPVAEGDFWGLRWAGNGKAGLLQGMTDSGALSWDDSAAGGSVKIFTNATHTMVGYVPLTSGAVFRFK